MRQIVYISTRSRDAAIDVDTILAVSRRNNGRQSVTGLLFYDGKRFLQALEGADAAVEATLQRIKQDARHRAVVVLSDRTVEVREFGDWDMACRHIDDDGAEGNTRLETLVAGATPSIRATFESFAKVSRAA